MSLLVILLGVLVLVILLGVLVLVISAVARRSFTAAEPNFWTSREHCGRCHRRTLRMDLYKEGEFGTEYLSRVGLLVCLACYHRAFDCLPDEFEVRANDPVLQKLRASVPTNDEEES